MIYEAADKWKFVETVERQEGGTNAGESRRNQSQQQQSSARGTYTRACFKCGDQGNIARDCPKPRAPGAGENSPQDKSGSSGGRHSGRGRGNGGRGRGGSGRNQTETDGGSSTAASSNASSAPAPGPSSSSMPRRAVFVGGNSVSVGSAGADSSPPIGQAGLGSGTSPASATAVTAPSTYSESWSGWNANEVAAATSRVTLPWRQVTLGHHHGSPSTGIVPIDHSAECIRADLSLPGAVGS